MIIKGSFIEQCTRKWKLCEVSNIIDHFDIALRDRVNGSQHVDFSAYERIILHIAAKSIVSSREIIQLCNTGFADGALSLARILYEHLVILLFFESKEKDAGFDHMIDDYNLDLELQVLRGEKQIGEYFAQERLPEIEKQIEECKNRAHRKVATRDYWWAGVNSFKNMVDVVCNNLCEHESITIRMMSVLYLRASQSIHSSSLGNILRLGFHPRSNVLNTLPTDEGQHLPLYFTCMAMIGIICFVCDRFGIDNAEYKTELNSLSNYYEERIKQKGSTTNA